jgi:hypothetical protein
MLRKNADPTSQNQVWPLFHLQIVYLILLTGRSIPDWPRLLHLYSRFKPGKTVHEWMKLYEVECLGIDVRRFTSFGVVKVSWKRHEIRL